MVSQNVQAGAADKRAEATFRDASATLHEVAYIYQGHLDARDELLTKIGEEFGFNPASVIDDAPAEETTVQVPRRTDALGSATGVSAAWMPC